MSNLEQSILKKQKTIKVAIKLLLSLLFFLLGLVLFYSSLDEFEPLDESIDKFKLIVSNVIRLDCKDPIAGGRTSNPGQAWFFLQGAPEWLSITLNKLNNAKSCTDFYSKVKLGQEIKVLLKIETKTIAHIEVDGEVLFSHSEYISDKEIRYENTKWLYLIMMCFCLFYFIVTYKRAFT